MQADDADEVLDELDGIARGVCPDDYGLPLYDAIAGPELRAVVAAAIREAVAAERCRCERIAESEVDSVAGREILVRIRGGTE